MKILSLFDGISCARVALERAGIPIELYYASEVDKYAIQIAQKNYQDTKQLGDIRTITRDLLSSYSGNVEIDLLIGGSPCQDLSIAKKERKGLDGVHSGLFWEYVRILKEVKPKYFILENVNSMPKEAKDTITKELGVEPIMINAALVSAQNRKRLFWIGKLTDKGHIVLVENWEYEKVNISQPEDKGILLKDILEDNANESYSIYNNKITVGKATTLGSNSQCFTAKTGQGIIRVGQIGKGGQGNRIYSPKGKSVVLSALGGGRGAKTGLYAVAQWGRNIVDGKRKDILGAKTEQRIEVGGSEKAHTITSVFKDSMVMEDSIIRKLTPRECERLQSLPDNYTEGVSNTQRYKTLGNAFNVEVVAHILKGIAN